VPGTGGEANALLVRQAAQGDERAWRELVDRNHSLVWGVCRAYTSSLADAEDVMQATWLLLAENLERLRNPEAVAAWLVTTARRESIRLGKARQRETPAGIAAAVFDRRSPGDTPEQRVLRSMRNHRLWQSFSQLSERCQQLLRVLSVAPEATYAQVSEALGIPRGSIGPKRGRCLAELRKRMLAAEASGEAA
jgi:RNA polymerase sigma factor (sigma-70 family)